jgi:hypothetical protein
MPNSTISLQNVIDDASTFADIAPVTSVGGFSDQPALRIANRVMTTMLAQTFNWKFNRFQVPPFVTISWQQDYATVNLTTLGWIENCILIDINNTSLPKPIWWPQAVKDLQQTSGLNWNPARLQICWLPNDQLTQGVWPGALAVFTQPLGAASTPSNPFINILDRNGNIQILTQYGTTGAAEPAWPATGAPAGVLTQDGTCVWSVANPKAQGFRLDALPAQSGVVYQIRVIAQARPPQFVNRQQTLEPVPDDFASYWMEGFRAYCYERSPDPSVKAQFAAKERKWMDGMLEAVRKGNREPDSYGFYPDRCVVDTGMPGPIGPANPYGPDYW